MAKYQQRYDRVTVRSYKDPDMAGMPERNRDRGKWFVHGIKGGTADLLKITEKKSKAVKFARERAKSVDQDGQTIFLVKDLEGDVSERKAYAQQTETFTP